MAGIIFNQLAGLNRFHAKELLTEAHGSLNASAVRASKVLLSFPAAAAGSVVGSPACWPQLCWL